jgi:hypothetical protein
MANATFAYSDTEGRKIRAVRLTAPQDAEELFGEMEFDGVKGSDWEYEFKNDPKVDPRFSQRCSDLNVVAHLLLAAGYRPLRLAWEDKPDVRTELADGSTAFVEAAEVIEKPSARFAGALTYVNVGIAKAAQENSALDRPIELRASPREDGRYDTKAILADTLRLLQNDDDVAAAGHEFEEVGASYPVLQSRKARYRRLSAPVFPRIEADASGGVPDSTVSQTHLILEQKRKLAATYTPKPLWLALYITDPDTVPLMVVDALAEIRLDFSPFERLFVGDQQNVMVYSVET